MAAGRIRFPPARPSVRPSNPGPAMNGESMGNPLVPRRGHPIRGARTMHFSHRRAAGVSDGRTGMDGTDGGFRGESGILRDS